MGRRLFVLDAAGPNDVPDVFHTPDARFVSLLAWDALRISADEIGTVAERLLQAGCVYVCCWGPDCERVHDVFDEIVAVNESGGPCFMSSWHANEPLSDAVFFSLFSAWPGDEIADRCRSVVGLSIGSPSWASEMRSAFADPNGFRDRWMAN